MSILELITFLIFLAAAFTLINITVLKLPSTIGLMLIALMMSFAILVLGYFFPSITEGAEHIMEEFDFEEVLMNVYHFDCSSLPNSHLEISSTLKFVLNL